MSIPINPDETSIPEIVKCAGFERSVRRRDAMLQENLSMHRRAATECGIILEPAGDAEADGEAHQHQGVPVGMDEDEEEDEDEV